MKQLIFILIGLIGGILISRLIQQFSIRKPMDGKIRLSARDAEKLLTEFHQEIRRWQEVFDEEIERAPHQKFRYDTFAKDAKLIFEQRRKLWEKLDAQGRN